MENNEHCKSIKDTLTGICKDISSLEKEKNLGKIVKNYNKINDDIKNTFQIIHELQNKIRDLEKIGSEQNNIIEIFDDSQYESYEEELSNNKIDNIINNDNLAEQIDCFKNLITKLNSCKKYLESKKTIIIDCGKECIENKNIDQDKDKGNIKTKNKEYVKENTKNTIKKNETNVKLKNKLKTESKKDKYKKYKSSSSSDNNKESDINSESKSDNSD
jgi:hypothetical protein